MTASRITGTGYYQPARVLTNAELETMVDTTDEWIRSRVGIEARRIADTETVADMAIEAAGKALAAAGGGVDDVDLVVVATTTAIDRCPNTANRVAAALNLTGSPAAIELNTACSGFNHALAVADQSVRLGVAKRALVVGAEKMSQVTDWTDRNTCVLVGDGAGAVVIEACPDEEWGIGPVHWGSVPEKSRAVLVEGDVPRFSQEGQTVFRWATGALAPFAREVCKASGVELDDLVGFVPHQANLRIIEPLVRQLGLGDKVIARDVVESGNTAAASVPLAFAKLVERGELKSGDLTLLLGFGGGLAVAGHVVRCP